MDKKDAKLFTEFCQFAWFMNDVIPLVFDSENEIYNSKGVNFGSLKHLDAIGLISFEPTSGYIRKGFGKYAQIYYFGQPVLIEFTNDKDNQMQIGKVLLTQAGQELAPICGANRNNEFYEYVIDYWYKQGLILSSPLPNK